MCISNSLVKVLVLFTFLFFLVTMLFIGEGREDTHVIMHSVPFTIYVIDLGFLKY